MRPRVVELVGLPGTGKSTVFETLLRSDPLRIAAVDLDRLGHLPQMVRHAFRLAAPFAAQYSRISRLRWRKFTRMVQLATYHDLVAAYRTTPPDLVLLDQGPVYLLSVLQKCLADEPGSNSRLFERYWQTTLARWAESLDLLVVLDASEEVLFERIQRRDKQHRVRGTDRAQATAYFQRARIYRDLILLALQQQENAPAVLRVDTESMTAAAIVAQLQEMLLAPQMPAGRGG